MKRYLLLVLLAVTLAGGMPAAEAVLPEDEIFTEVLISTAAPDVQVSSNLAAQHRVSGYDFTDSAAGIVGLYDTATAATAMAGTNLFSEAKVAAGDVSPVRFPYPRRQATGVTAVFSTATGVVTVYYR